MNCLLCSQIEIKEQGIGQKYANWDIYENTTEIYFNQRAEKDAHRVAEITAAIRAASTVSVHKAV